MTLPVPVASAIAPLPIGYADLLDRVVATLDSDERIVALWLGGSLGRGVADAGSDLDLIVTVADAAAEEIRAAGDAMWAFLDPVIALEIPYLPGCFTLLTSGGLRVDTVLEAESEVASSPYRQRVMVFDRRAEPTPLPAPEHTDDGPNLDRMQAIATEFARQLAIFPDAVVARRDWLLGQEAVHNYRTFLYQLYVESNAPLPPMGVKQWSAKLTAAQRDRLSTLTPPAADATSVIAAMRDVQWTIRTEGRALLEAAGGSWPEAAVDAALCRWRARGIPDTHVE